MGGSGLGNAFAAYAGAGADASAADIAADIAEVIGHEMMHSWAPDAIGGVAKDSAQAAIIGFPKALPIGRPGG